MGFSYFLECYFFLPQGEEHLNGQAFPKEATHWIQERATNIALLIHEIIRVKSRSNHVINDKIIVIQIHGLNALCLKTTWTITTNEATLCIMIMIIDIN